MALIKLHLGNLLDKNPDLLSASEVETLYPQLEKIQSDMATGMKEGRLDWMKLPYNEDLINEIEEYYRENNHFENFVVMGIGGSSLGNRTLHDGLNHAFHNHLPHSKRSGSKIFYTDTVDPSYLSDLKEVIDLKKTLFNVITKSGSTAETMSQCLHFVNCVKEEIGSDFHKHFVITTDREKGALQDFIRDNKLKKFVIDDTVGGRFSVFSPVGLLSARFSGIDIAALYRGVKNANDNFFSKNPQDNIPLLYAAVQFLLYGKDHIQSVLMPYNKSLTSLADWYCQLWAESLGKLSDLDGKTVEIGTQPIRAVGPTDQHSMLQLFIEGKNDKVYTFIRVNNFGSTLNIGHSVKHLESQSYLVNKPFSELINAEQSCTEMALCHRKRPVLRFELETVCEESLACLMQNLMIATAVMGPLFNVNPFDQPGVELGKQFTYGLMEKDGFEEKKTEVEDFYRDANKFVFTCE